VIDLLIAPCGQLLTLAGDNHRPRRGPAMSELGIVLAGALGVDTRRRLVEYAGPSADVPRDLLAKNCEVISSAGKVVMPGFVDSHTHLVFAGSRADEFYRRAAGESYQEIAKAGGGIAVTMGETRRASEEELAQGALKRLIQLYRNGTTTVETKTGYGLDPESEWSSLRAIDSLKQVAQGLVFSTYLGAHLIPPEYRDNRQAYVDSVVSQLREIASTGKVDFFDIFVDPLAFTLEESKEIARAGLEAGLRLRLHGDEFGDDGTAAWAASVGAVSVDHLGGIGESGIAALASSDTVATLLPATMFFSGHGKFAPGRKLIEAGAAVALATDLNPGSSLVYSMPLTMTLAVLEMQMSAEECIVASTINGAHALCAADCIGSLEPGKRADFLILDLPHYRELAYHVGANYITAVYHGGKLFDTASTERDLLS
jgi:imidazolonepropionase